jgi:phage-related minor tail protein
MVARVGMGEREFEIQSKVNEVYRDQAKELLNLARQRDAGDIDQETYEARTAALADFTAKQVQIVRDGYDRMAEAQGNWANGAIKALKDYADQAADVAGQTYGLFTDAFKGAEDVLTDFITKGKADWKGYFDNLAAEITRFAVRQQLAKLAKKFLPGMADGQESQAGALSSAAGQLAASATPLYGAAAALSSAAAALAAAGTANGVSGSGSSGGGWLSAIAGLFGNSGSGSSSGTADYSYLLSAVFGSYAKGAAFNRGAVTAFAGGGVVGSPTFFPMANRRLGLMGEAGPEAIVPLHKGPDGKLGIRMERDMPQRSGPSVLNQTVIVQGLMDSRTPNQLAQASRREQNRAASRNS